MDSPNEKESKRLTALYNLNILYSGTEERFDRVTKAAMKIFSVPVAGISLIDKDKIWFKSVQGLAVSELPREGSFSSYILNSDGVFHVEDAQAHEVLKSSPLVTGEAKIRFYTGIPLKAAGEYVVGNFFIADVKPRKLDDGQLSLLSDLSFWAEEELAKGKALAEERKIRADLVSRNQELAREKARLDAMLSNIGEGVVGISDRGEIVFTNPQVEVITGFTQAEITGKLMIQAFVLVDKDGKPIAITNQPVRNALFYKKKEVSADYYFLRKDKTRFAASIIATPVVVFNQIVGGVVVIRDISKEKEIDRMKTEFISLASHQLRTPLSAMKWFCEILLDGDAGKLTDEQIDILKNIYRSNERMIDLVNTLLNISRIESGRIIIDPRPTNLKNLLDEVIIEVKQKLELKRQHLGVSIHGELPMVSLDQKLIRHVYMNLLTNAIKYTKPGGEIVVIISKSGSEIISQISDNGYGIPKSQQERVFKKFFRGENIIKVETEGTGLGLYLVKAIVESSGGRIWFKSEEGKGSTFWFSLPVGGVAKKEGEVSIDA